MAESVACILFEGKKVLLIKRRDVPVWVLPGGGIDAGETAEEAACREMEEETGFQVEIVRKVAEYIPTNRLAKPTHFFEVRAIGGTAQTGDETAAVDFFAEDDLPKRLPPPYASWIRDAATLHPRMLKKKIEGVTYGALMKLFFVHPILVGRFLLTRCGIHFH